MHSPFCNGCIKSGGITADKLSFGQGDKQFKLCTSFISNLQFVSKNTLRTLQAYSTLRNV
jgi:hypothetical protein